MDPRMSVRHTKNTAEATRKHDRSEQPSGLEASSSSARQRSGLGPRLRGSVGCLGYAGPQRRHSVLTQVERGVFPLPPSSITYMPRLWRGARQENSSSCLRPVNPAPDTGRVVAKQVLALSLSSAAKPRGRGCACGITRSAYRRPVKPYSDNQSVVEQACWLSNFPNVITPLKSKRISG